jgi:hypothetical protein
MNTRIYWCLNSLSFFLIKTNCNKQYWNYFHELNVFTLNSLLSTMYLFRNHWNVIYVWTRTVGWQFLGAAIWSGPVRPIPLKHFCVLRVNTRVISLPGKIHMADPLLLFLGWSGSLYPNIPNRTSSSLDIFSALARWAPGLLRYAVCNHLYSLPLFLHRKVASAYE